MVIFSGMCSLHSTCTTRIWFGHTGRPCIVPAARDPAHGTSGQVVVLDDHEPMADDNRHAASETIQGCEITLA